MDDRNPIYYVGDWTPREKNTVGKAVERLEEIESIQSLAPETEPPWICLQVDAEQSSYYVACWLAWNRYLMAGSAKRLAQKISRHGRAGVPIFERLPRAEAGGLPKSRIRRVAEYVWEHLGEGITVAEMAEVVRMSEHHFARLFKRATGLSPHQYLIEERMVEAQRLLQETDLKVGDVGRQVGYQDASYFASIFRRHTGFSPSAYRRAQNG